MAYSPSWVVVVVPALIASAGAVLAGHLMLVRRRRRLHQILDHQHDESDPHQVREVLLPSENILYQLNVPPVVTLTWFRGDVRQASDILQQRLQAILDANPWLGGHVGKNYDSRAAGHKLCLVYNNNRKKQLRAQDYMTIIVNGDSESSPISRTTPVTELFPACRPFYLKNGAKEPLVNVTILPCQDNPNTHFALIFAVSHLVADGHTYYTLLSQLCSDSVPQSLTADRIRTTSEQQREASGPENYDLIQGRTILNIAWQVLLVKLGLMQPTTELFAVVDSEQLKMQKKAAITSSESSSNNDHEDDDDDVRFVSSNDILTSWFFRQADCPVAFMGLNWRNRLNGHTDRHAGNYMSGRHCVPNARLGHARAHSKIAAKQSFPAQVGRSDTALFENLCLYHQLVALCSTTDDSR